MSEAGPSSSDQGKRKRRGPSPSGTSTSSGVKEEIEFQETKRQRKDGVNAGVGNQVFLPIQNGLPGAVLLHQGGNGGLLDGRRMRADPANELVPAISRSRRTPSQWAEAMPKGLSFGTGTGFTSANDVSDVGRAAHQVAAFSPIGLVDFVISPSYSENRVSRLDQTRAQLKAGRENAERLPHDQGNARGRGRGRGGGRGRGNGGGDGRDPAAPEAVTRELSDNEKNKIAEAVLLVFPVNEEVDMSEPDCDSCRKTTHKTGHCPEPSAKCDTAVDSFCESTFHRGHPLDSETKSNGDYIRCRVLAEHSEMNHMVDIFIHLVIYRIHKPPLRVRSGRFCWINVLIKFADAFCGGQMPAAIVENGGLLPYTKDDVASYKSKLKKFDEIGVKDMPRGELDGKTIEEIKEMKRNRRLRRQIYAVYGEEHTEEKLNKLAAINTDDRSKAVPGASKPAGEGKVEAPTQNPEAGNSASNGPIPELDSTMAGTEEPLLSTAASIPLLGEDKYDCEIGAQEAAESLAGFVKSRGAMAGKSRAVTNQPAPNGMETFLMGSNQPLPTGPPTSNVELPPEAVQIWAQEMDRGNIQDDEMLTWATQVALYGTIARPWSDVSAKLVQYKASGQMSPEFEAIMTKFAATQQ